MGNCNTCCSYTRLYNNIIRETGDKISICDFVRIKQLVELEIGGNRIRALKLLGDVKSNDIYKYLTFILSFVAFLVSILSILYNFTDNSNKFANFIVLIITSLIFIGVLLFLVIKFHKISIYNAYIKEIIEDELKNIP